MESKREADGGMCARPGYDADGKMHAIFAFTKRYAHEAIDALKAWRERQVLANKLNNLDDGLLLDIGVVRGLIPLCRCPSGRGEPASRDAGTVRPRYERASARRYRARCPLPRLRHV